MNTEIIGTNAGSVWVALNTADALGVKQLKKSPNLKTKKFMQLLVGLRAKTKYLSHPTPTTKKKS